MAEFLLDNTRIAPEINALNVDKLTALDELYLRRWEEGFSELKQILGGNGAKRSSDLSFGLEPNFLMKLTKQDSKWLERMEPSFLVLAGLVVSVTYAAVLSPPGGLWQDDSLQPGSIQNHTAGAPILLSKNRPRYYIFYVFNTIGFCSSFATIAVIVGKHQVSPTPSLVDVSVSLCYNVLLFGLLFSPYIKDYCSKIMKWQRNGEGTQRSVVIQMTTDHQNP
ncbi:hypothetical protein MRB53_025037 [Persea americana]|uniref:Uncharacterized protein n=1 Tax=Persea americana TaxID=3435 RepID=A0ACC2LE52_PERAE|nr:hypothetical protein MRB53_025037 [Persea americana]